MDLSLLRSFAADVRVELTGVVAARLVGVLLPGSVERVEFPASVQRLEAALMRSGRDAVVDQVAYTWFNRLVALRFMDVNGYTGVGVVSPAGGALAGQPEVLADAKAGHIDTDVVAEKTRNHVLGLLAGDVTSTDPQGEAYKLLLAGYCNFWAGPMPFMFEHSGDFTELLVPDDLLSDRSIVARIVQTLTPPMCMDVEVIGWLYQFYIAARKDEVFAGFKKNKKATAQEIPAATQLFTPHWIVKYLVENSLGRLWLLNNPRSALAEHMEYYIPPVETETDFLVISSPEELKILDPACGSGHMLTYGFDLLYLIYEESGYAPSDIPKLILQHNLYGTEIDPRAGALAAFALTMKARGKQKTFLNPKNDATPNLCVLEPVVFTHDELDLLLTAGGNKAAEVAYWQAFEDADTFGSLIRPNQNLTGALKKHLESLGSTATLFSDSVLNRAQAVIRQAEYLSTRYHIVIANPPYMGSGNMGEKLSAWIPAHFKDTKSGLDGAFIERGLTLTVETGLLAMITMQSWMFLSRYEDFRTSLLQNNHIKTMLYLGTGAFPEIQGEKVNNVAFVLEVANANAMISSSFIDLSRESKISILSLRDYSHVTYERSVRDLQNIPGSPICFWASDKMIEILQSKRQLGSIAEIRVGLDTGNNSQFIRQWHEVNFGEVGLNCESKEELWSRSARWVPHTKGGEYRKWYGNLSEVLAFDKDSYDTLSKQGNKLPSREFYFRESFCYTRVSSSDLSLRLSPRGTVFNSASPSIFAEPEESLAIAGLLNSPALQSILACISPTLNYQAGELRRLPIAPELKSTEMNRMVSELISIHKDDWDSSEQSWDFLRSPLSHSTDEETTLVDLIDGAIVEWERKSDRATELEANINALVLSVYGLEGAEDDAEKPNISLMRSLGSVSINHMSLVAELVSYSVGCMFGRYSLDVPGLVLADQDDSLADYLSKVPVPSFMPDNDNVVPILSDGWFEDDVVERFREFLRVSFGVGHFEENFRFVEESLGKDIRKYFLQDFYRDHVQRYKKRPIYWMFSSPKGSFNALIYMHRYRPDTVSVVLNDYLHEFQEKLRSRRGHVDQVVVSTSSTAKEQSAARKESEQIGKMLLELEDWERSVLYPLATQQIEIDLDDGVKANYPKFGAALNNKYTGF